MRQALAREVGEVDVDRALEEGGGWRGRAQLISLLKTKVKQLQRAAAARAGRAFPWCLLGGRFRSRRDAAHFFRPSSAMTTECVLFCHNDGKRFKGF